MMQQVYIPLSLSSRQLLHLPLAIVAFKSRHVALSRIRPIPVASDPLQESKMQPSYLEGNHRMPRQAQ